MQCIIDLDYKLLYVFNLLEKKKKLQFLSERKKRRPSISKYKISYSKFDIPKVEGMKCAEEKSKSR